MAVTPRIGFLADHPEALSILESLFKTEWASYYGTNGPGDARKDLLAYSNRSLLPVGLVAFFGTEPCGVIALKSESIITHSHLGPWIGAGIVKPQLRRQGIGAKLLSAIENVARDLEFEAIYSGTSTANTLLLREGWQFIELVEYDSENISIFKKAL